MNVFLDDLRPAPDGFTLAETIEEAIELISSNPINILSLDHDLGGEDGSYTKTGYDLCKWLAEEWYTYKERGLFDVVISPKHIYIHTSNPSGRINMIQLLQHYKPLQIKLYNYPMPNYNLATGEILEDI
jgi:hypothetical protein